MRCALVSPQNLNTVQWQLETRQHWVILNIIPVLDGELFASISHILCITHSSNCNSDAILHILQLAVKSIYIVSAVALQWLLAFGENTLSSSPLANLQKLSPCWVPVATCATTSGTEWSQIIQNQVHIYLQITQHGTYRTAQQTNDNSHKQIVQTGTHTAHRTGLIVI